LCYKLFIRDKDLEKQSPIYLILYEDMIDNILRIVHKRED